MLVQKTRFSSVGTCTESLYVSNLNYQTTSDGLQKAFPGSVHAQVVVDKSTQQSKGLVS